MEGSVWWPRRLRCPGRWVEFVSVAWSLWRQRAVPQLIPELSGWLHSWRSAVPFSLVLGNKVRRGYQQQSTQKLVRGEPSWLSLNSQRLCWEAGPVGMMASWWSHDGSRCTGGRSLISGAGWGARTLLRELAGEESGCWILVLLGRLVCGEGCRCRVSGEGSRCRLSEQWE